MNSVQECYDALENGYPLILHDGSTLYKRPTGVYVYTPFAPPTRRIAIMQESVTSEDLLALFCVLLLHDAIIDEHEDTLPRDGTEGVIEADPRFIPYGQRDF